MCSWTTAHCSSFYIESGFSLSISVLSMRTFLRGCFPSPVPLSLSTVVISVMGAYFSPFHVGFMAGLPGFASLGSGLHLGAGCQ